MAKTISQRINDAFPEGAAADAEKFADKILNSWNEVSSSLGKLAILFVVLVGIFELLIYGPSSQSLTIGSITFANTSIVRIALPAIVAYVVFDGFQLAGRWGDLEAAYYAITKIYAPRVDQNALDYLIKPTLPSIWGIGWGSGSETSTDRFNDAVRAAVGFTALIILPIAFEVQAYYLLFYRYGYRNIFLWISVAFSAIILISVNAWNLLSPSNN